MPSALELPTRQGGKPPWAGSPAGLLRGVAPLREPGCVEARWNAVEAYEVGFGHLCLGRVPFVEWRGQYARARPARGGRMVGVGAIECGRCCTAPRGVPQSDRFKRLRSPCGGCGLPSPHPTFVRFEFQGAVPVFGNCAARLHPSSGCWGVDGGGRGRHAALPGRNRPMFALWVQADWPPRGVDDRTRAASASAWCSCTIRLLQTPSRSA